MTARTGLTASRCWPGAATWPDLHWTFQLLVQIGGKNSGSIPTLPAGSLCQRLPPRLEVERLVVDRCGVVFDAHFDHWTGHRCARLRGCQAKSGKRPAIIVPRNVRDIVSDLGYGPIVELEWWQSFQLGNLEITHVPSRHWGARMVRDMHRGFGGYVLRAGQHSLYHAGDTAYFEGFREIGERLRPEVALLPIGAYHPDSFRRVHTSPEDAVQAFLDLGACWMVPMHYGTFRLSYEPVDEPVERLKAEAIRRGIEKKVRVLEEGVTTFLEEDLGEASNLKGVILSSGGPRLAAEVEGPAILVTLPISQAARFQETNVRKTAFVLSITLLLGELCCAADTYQTGKIVKWDNGTYPDGKKTKAWIVYQVQGENLLYSIARHKETKPQMDPGEQIQYHVKGNQMTVVNAKGKKNKYQIVGQSQAPPAQ